MITGSQMLSDGLDRKFQQHCLDGPIYNDLALLFEPQE
jgi:hypothetical protein